jgi:hypothetical protein
MARSRSARHLTTTTVVGCAPRRWASIYKKYPEQVRREAAAQNEAAFEAVMAPGRERHEAEKVAKDAVEAGLLMESFGKPTPVYKLPGLHWLGVLKASLVQVQYWWCCSPLRPGLYTGGPMPRRDEHDRLAIRAITQHHMPKRLAVAEIAKLAGLVNATCKKFKREFRMYEGEVVRGWKCAEATAARVRKQ